MKESTKLKVEGISLLILGAAIYISGIKLLIKANDVHIREIVRDEVNPE